MHRSPLAWLRLLLAAVLGAFLLGGPLHAAETAATFASLGASGRPVDQPLPHEPHPLSQRAAQRTERRAAATPAGEDGGQLHQGRRPRLAGPGPVRVLSLPTHADRVDDAEVLSVLRQLQAAEREGPVLMHCKHGNNRTGLFAAMYRIVVQGWDKQAALEEMQHGGFGDEDDMRDASAYVRGADVDGLRLAMANGECSPSRFAVCHVREWMAQALDRP